MAFSPVPPLDGAPPTPPGIPAGAVPAGRNASFNAMTPTQQPEADSTGSLQIVQLALQTGAAVTKGIMLLGQLLPGFAPVAAQLDMQLRGGLKAALQQGLSPTTEPPAIPELDQLGQLASQPQDGSMTGSTGGLNG